jgi:photosystem II stability/assembly factor-like uncharacterized protein
MDRAILCLATDRGVVVLKPVGESTEYSIAAQGLLNRKCGCISQMGDGRLVAGTEDFFLHTSSNGLEWKASLDGLNRQHITAFGRHPQHSQILLCGTSSPAAFMSVDYGKSWTSLAPLESLTNASRWTARKAPFRACVSSILCHPSHNGVIVVGIEVGGLAASRDAGKTWSDRDSGLHPDVRVVLAPPVAGRLYVGTGAGFFCTDDLGGTWHEKNDGLPYQRVQAMVVAPSNPDLIMLSVSGSDEGSSAVLQSRDGGKSWTMASDGLPRLDDRLVTSLAFGRGGCYAGTNKGDLFLLDNLDGRWIRLGVNYAAINAIQLL